MTKQPYRGQRIANRSFNLWLSASVAGYTGLVLLLLIACVSYVWLGGNEESTIWEVFQDPLIWSSMKLTYWTCSLSAVISMLIALPVGYALSRRQFRLKSLVEAVVDIPMILPPLVVGLALLILFTSFPPGREGLLDRMLGGVVFEVEAILLAQVLVASSFAIRSMKIAFDQVPERAEQLARSLGAGKGRVFFSIVLPQVRRGLVTAFAISWARCLGEFGPILVFAGATRGKTEVLSTSIFLELNVGRVQSAVVIALCMILMAVVTLAVVRLFGERSAE